jgi:hypothetical protein
MKRLVFDEWVWADLNGENGEEAQRETLWLLQRVLEKCDQLVTVRGSPFLRKYYEMARQANIGDPRREIVKRFRNQFLSNSKKLYLLQEESLPDIPTDLESKVKEDDKYLVRAYLAGKADLLVTTDNPLLKALNESDIRCMDKDAFASKYLKNDLTGEL